ncbi:BfmA/BtgA family mobilization protein [Aquimarina gracilis]|uniref:BfmA/BtgA family mobilization protein n=1 Tax=Aquimarina gracilis TaxID=874422 RepID=A0ABU5ZRR8_9FLAO|nr:BfmA/BtgA family mobilization protein [Aquimarina gracilis]MEB3344328.1 BfmA/BtgA family mobilization protein [Aquimarina gracilis]
MKKKSIIIDSTSHRDLKKLADEHNRSIGSFTADMILFFKKTGTDPQAIKGKSASEMIKVVDRRIVSFFKTQESEILYPLQTKVLENGKKSEELLSKLVNDLNTIFSKIKKKDEIQQHALLVLAEYLDKDRSGLARSIQNVLDAG